MRLFGGVAGAALSGRLQLHTEVHAAATAIDDEIRPMIENERPTR